MSIEKVSIKNFRGIGGEDPLVFSCDDLNIIIGDNGTSKTAILEAINFCLSSNYAASRLSLKDFYQGGDKDIEIKLFFKDFFDVSIPDGFASQTIQCNGIALVAKKRDKSATGRAFNDLVVADHYYLPLADRGNEGWSITRRNNSNMKVTERQLALSYASAEYPKSFYFGKNRDKQLQRGFNSSISNVIDDLNWRFEKNQRTKVDEDKFKHKRKDAEKYILENTDGETLKKTITETNKTLKSIGVDPVDLSIIKTLTPYDNSEVVRRFDGFELPVDATGSGIAMVTALIFLETLASISKDEICIIIDEPELHLHPTLQDKLEKHLEDISKNTQIFISTHSPFFFKNCYGQSNVKVIISEIESDKVVVEDAKDKGFGLFKWSPSWGEICYFAYNLPTIEFHDDLYAALQDKHQTETILATEAWLISNGQTKEIKWNNSSGVQQEETLMTYIRNRIHHGDNLARPMYTLQQLADSTKRMITLLKI